MSVNPFVNYTTAKVGNIPAAKLERALKGLTIRLTNKELSGDRVMLVHPQNARMIKMAKRAKKGLSTQFTPFEALADLRYHDNVGEGMHGGSLWSWLKNKAYPWLKSNWGIIKPLVSKIADVAIPAAATALGAPEAAIPVRSGVKALTGVGAVRKSRFAKGSEEAREHMASIRAMRGKKEIDGKSFRMP